MAYEHESGLPNAFDRAKNKPEQQSVLFYGDRPFIQMAELNEMQTIARGRHDRLSRLVARDGDRIAGADAIVDVDAGTVTLAEGQIWIAGDRFPVLATVLSSVAMTGRVEIGVRLVRSYITHETDPSLVGLVPGSLAEGEGGAAREVAGIAWAIATDDGDGEFYPVYLLQDGTILDQKEPPLLDGVTQALAVYDRVHGHYIVSGCRVTALGADGGFQNFSIEQGEANISGFKRTRAASLRHAEPEDWDEAAVPGETHTYPGGASATFTLDFFPLSEVTGILLEKERTVTLTRGALANGIDGLPDTSVIQILEVKQGATVYTTWIKTGNGVDWAPAGAEPATGSSYDVKYRYRANVVANSTTDRTITVSGGATGGEAILSYTYKLPRIDLLCLDVSGAPVYVKGVPARANPMVPVAPLEVLPLCEIHNDWINKPTIINNGVSVIPYGELWKLWNVVLDHTRLIELERLKSGIDSREPVAKKGVFVDPFVDDTYRDLGEAQTASLGNNMMQLAIDVTIYQSPLVAPVMLDYSEQVIVSQKLKTGCVKINPYANFTPLPGVVKLTPAVDFWTEHQTVWTSPQTNEFNRGIRTDGGPLQQTTTKDEVVDRRQEQAEYLRSINVTFTISGFGFGEVLSSLTFDGLDVKPGGVLAGDAQGKITGAFVIPANVTAGTKEIRAVGAGGTRATAFFTGQGIIDIDVLRKVTTIEHWNSPPPPPPPPAPVPGEPPRVVVRRNGNNNAGDKSDPQAQNFALTEPRQLVGVNFHVCNIGDPLNHLLVNQVRTENGIPTTDVLSEAFVPMQGTSVGWRNARYNFPVFTSDDQTYSFVIKSDDNAHSISIAKLGAFDASLHQFVTVHPYPVGPRSSSVNAESWTFHQDESLAFELVAAWYPVTTKTVELGSYALVNCSDLQVRAVFELPDPECSIVFEIERTNGEIIRLLPYQVLQLKEYINETVELRAVLKGTQKLSPVLHAGVQLIAGSIRTTGDYVTRAFKFGSAVRLTSYIKAMLPAGSTMTLEYDKADDNWIAVPLLATEALSDPAWVERKFEKTAITATEGRLRIKITGGPASRPAFGDFGAAIM